MKEIEKKINETAEKIEKNLEGIVADLITTIATANANTFVFTPNKFEEGTQIAAQFADHSGHSLIISSGVVEKEFEADPKFWAQKLLEELLHHFVKTEDAFITIKELAAKGVASMMLIKEEDRAKRIIKDYAVTVENGLSQLINKFIKTLRFVIKSFETKEERVAYTNGVIKEDKEFVDSINYPQKEKMN